MSTAWRAPIPTAEMDKEIAQKKDPRAEWVKNQTGLGFFVVKSNANFETFYAAQKTCQTDDEWSECLEAMRRELPQGFRVDESSLYAPFIKKTLLEYSAKHPILQAKPWCPESLIWQMTGVSRWNIVEKEENRAFHRFLMTQNENGTISRQELVSMIPVLLLDVKSHHKVLDICASPGSKTKQVLSMMHKQAGPLPSGMVIANEYDPARCDKLCHNVGRVMSPCLITVNHDGGSFPQLKLGDDKELLFDRIVCDVPCSGDGTIRKNPNVWDNWTPGSGNGRHFVQYNIIERAVEMLEVGGMVAYSSCAINPIENEAVLARLMKLSQGAIELVDVEGQLPGFNWAKGHTQWRVFDSEMNEYEKMEDVPENVAQTQIHTAMFSSNYQPTNQVDYHLERCMRLLPHHNDCGGFFVALLKKTRELPWQNKDRSPDEMEAELFSARLKRKYRGLTEAHTKAKKASQPKHKLSNRKKPVKNMWCRRSFFNFYESDNGVELGDDLKFYGLPDELQKPSLYYKSSSEKDTKVYLTNQLVKDIIVHNLKDENSPVNLFHAGCKSLERSRKAQTSVKLSIRRETRLMPLIGERRTVRMSAADVRKLLAIQEGNTGSLEIEQLSSETCQRLKELKEVGPIKVVCECSGGDELVLLGHLGNVKVMLDVDKTAKAHAHFMLGDESL